MPQLTGNDEVLINAWPLAQQIEETRGKLHLQERDANAFYESSEMRKLKFESLVSRLREDNKEKRVELSKCINGDIKVISMAFHQRKEDFLATKRFTSMKTVSVMDQKVCEKIKQLNAIQYQREMKEARIQQLDTELKNLHTAVTSEKNVAREREIRRMQNKMDKAEIKFAAALNITRRYQEIMDHMQELCRNYPATLDVLEEMIKDSTQELGELRKMNEKAIKSSEEARQDLHSMEREMYQAKRARDQQLNETRKEVEKRKEVVERTEKRHRLALMGEASDAKAAKAQVQKAERQEKILTLDDAFEKIKQAINVSDIEDIVYRLENQGNTWKRLRSLEKEKTSKKNKLSEELAKLRTIFEELKFTSQRQIQQGRKMLDEMEEYMCGEENRSKMAIDKSQKHEKLLISLQSGIATLFEKLKDVKLKPPYHNFARGDPVEDLLQCGVKLNPLLTNLGLKRDLGAVLNKVDNAKLHQYLEAKLPPDNFRVRVDTDDISDDDEFLFDHDQENEGYKSREDIKRHGQDILNSKLKPKKKKGRKRNA